MLSRRVLSKEEESEVPDAEVTKEDQDKINDFSRMHNRVKALEEELKGKQKDKEDLTDVSSELELKELEMDETELIPYKIGDSFVALPLADATTMLSEATTEVETEIDAIEQEMSELQEKIDALKAHLYARFGRGINLEA